ncbi:MAG TPA: hypothetical protein DC005_03135, partial [Proteobacteria bacterium]|nr:hypothetical protein [Pseudomonadota bacterium]
MEIGCDRGPAVVGMGFTTMRRQGRGGGGLSPWLPTGRSRWPLLRPGPRRTTLLPLRRFAPAPPPPILRRSAPSIAAAGRRTSRPHPPVLAAARLSAMALRSLARQKVVCFDGAMGTSLQRLGLTADDFAGKEGCNELLVRTRPEVVAAVHASFLEAGADVVETNSFGALPTVLAEYGLADDAFDLARRAATLAREVADGFATPAAPRLVAGSMGGGTKLPTLGHIRFRDLAAGYTTLARGLIAGGADLLLIETAQDPLAVKAALVGAQAAMAAEGREVEVAVSFTVETTGTLLVGTEIGAAWAIVEPYPVAMVGMNCATGPAQMSDHLRTLCAESDRLISCFPNAGLPENVNGEAVYPLTPADLATALAHFVRDLGVNVVGGCCGTT